MSQAFDLVRARRETPGCEQVLHFDNAGAALMPDAVLDTIIGHLHLEAHYGGYAAAGHVLNEIKGVYELIALLLGCECEEIAIVENATMAWDLAFYSIPFRPGDRILTAEAAYASNYIAFLQMARRHGLSIETIPSDEHGQVSVAALGEMLDERVRLVAITHVPTNGGLVNPAASVGQVLRHHDALYLLDACQSVGQLPVNVAEIQCDFLSATGRKFLRGPRGTGFLFVRRDVLEKVEPPFLDLHAASWVAQDRYEMRPDARRFENWEANVANKMGLGAAVNYALTWGLDAIWERIRALAQMLRRQLRQISGVTVHDLGLVQGGIVTFALAGYKAAEVQWALREQQINVSNSTVFSTRLDMERRGLDEMVRASVHYYNSEAEVDRFCQTIAALPHVH